MAAKITALCNQKGGVGKSTTAFHLARAPETLRDVIVAGVWPGLDVAPTTGATLGMFATSW